MSRLYFAAGPAGTSNGRLKMDTKRITRLLGDSMTVAQLIEHLVACDQEARVVFGSSRNAESMSAFRVSNIEEIPSTMVRGVGQFCEADRELIIRDDYEDESVREESVVVLS